MRAVVGGGEGEGLMVVRVRVVLDSGEGRAVPLVVRTLGGAYWW